MYKEDEFCREACLKYPEIKSKNSWAKKYFELEMPSSRQPVNEADISAKRAWNLYRASLNNRLGLLLLGEVSMRSKLALVQNFGLTYGQGSGHETEEPWLSPWLGFDASKSAKPSEMAKVPGSTVSAEAIRQNKARGLQALSGSGSVLSDRLWTPLMNDAWLLGGVHKRQEFHLVTEGLGQQKLVASLEKVKREKDFAKRIERFGTSVKKAKTTETEVWLAWFNDNPQYLFETWGPRVLVRELIGLMTFGYKPNFSLQELGFYCADTGAAEQATITRYFEALNSCQFHQGSGGKTEVLKKLSDWLFGRENALRQKPW